MHVRVGDTKSISNSSVDDHGRHDSSGDDQGDGESDGEMARSHEAPIRHVVFSMAGLSRSTPRPAAKVASHTNGG